MTSPKLLTRGELLADPLAQFQDWYQDGYKIGLQEPSAMTLATASPDGFPSVRVVLLKEISQGGFVFYTNYESRKSRDMIANPRAALAFHWQPLLRQIRIEGRIQKVTREESEKYFRSRPRESQLGAWASRQSLPIASRQDLENTYFELKKRYEGQEVPYPEHWGGFRLMPEKIEFWQAREYRLHDRFLYTRGSDGNWAISQLSP